MTTLNDNPKWILEGALLTSDVPLSVMALRDCLDKRYSKAEVLQFLAQLQQDWSGRIQPNSDGNFGGDCLSPAGHARRY